MSIQSVAKYVSYETEQYCSSFSTLTYSCKRFVSEIDQSIQGIYKAILVDGNIQEFLIANPHGCAKEADMGHCGNVRVFLNECRCPELDRKSAPHLRAHYEDLAIKTVQEILDVTPCIPDQNFNIAIFGSGGLHGELVLMIKLLDKIKSGFEGTINLSLIDLDYIGCISNALEYLKSVNLQTQKQPLIELVGRKRELLQFLIELSQGLPSNIKLNVHVYGEARDYIAQTQLDENLRHDLLLGADIQQEQTENTVLEIEKTARRQSFLNKSGIVLLKKNGLPQVCEVNADLESCTPIPTPAGSSCLIS